MMDSLKVLRLYLATRLHFTNEKYDIFDQRAKVRGVTRKALESGTARYILIERIAKRFNTPSEVMKFLVPQWIYSNGADLYSPSQSEDNYVRWLKFKSAPDYFIRQDLHDKNLFWGNPGVILKAVQQNTITIESAIAIHKTYGILLDADYFVYNSLANTIKKSVNFIKFNENSVKEECEAV